jgi:hypothetical protein
MIKRLIITTLALVRHKVSSVVRSLLGIITALTLVRHKVSCVVRSLLGIEQFSIFVYLDLFDVITVV